MKSMTYSNFRNHLSDALDEVNNNHIPILITRKTGKAAVVIMSLADFNSYEETAHLLSSAKNVKRLEESIEELGKGKGKPKNIIEE